MQTSSKSHSPERPYGQRSASFQAQSCRIVCNSSTEIKVPRLSRGERNHTIMQMNYARRIFSKPSAGILKSARHPQPSKYYCRSSSRTFYPSRIQPSTLPISVGQLGQLYVWHEPSPKPSLNLNFLSHIVVSVERPKNPSRKRYRRPVQQKDHTGLISQH